MKLARGINRGARMLRSRLTGGSAVLLYHRVAESDRDPFKLCVSPAHFDEQMAEIARLGHPVSVMDLVRKHRDGSLPPRSIAVTFDDGFLDVAENALPILEKHGIPATVYCVSGNLGNAFWWDRLIEKIYGPEQLPGEICLSAGGGGISIATRDLGRAQIVKRLHARLLPVEPAERDGLLAELGRQTGSMDESQVPRSMTPDELKAFAGHPLITIGGHTVSHSRLADLPPARQGEEIASSIEDLARVTGSPVNTFSYPFGLSGRDFNGATMAAAAAAGLDHALAADTDTVRRRTNVYRLPRFWVHDRPGATLRASLRRWL